MTAGAVSPKASALLPGWYRDGAGRVWFCHMPYNGQDIVACATDEGWRTAASVATFDRWNWTHDAPPCFYCGGEEGEYACPICTLPAESGASSPSEASASAQATDEPIPPQPSAEGAVSQEGK